MKSFRSFSENWDGVGRNRLVGDSSGGTTEAYAPFDENEKKILAALSAEFNELSGRRYVYLMVRGVIVYESHTKFPSYEITRSVNPALYKALWRKAGGAVRTLAPLLKTAIKELETNGDKYRHLDNPKYRASVDHLLIFLKHLYQGCIQFPKAGYTNHG